MPSCSFVSISKIREGLYRPGEIAANLGALTGYWEPLKGLERCDLSTHLRHGSHSDARCDAVYRWERLNFVQEMAGFVLSVNKAYPLTAYRKCCRAILSPLVILS